MMLLRYRQCMEASDKRRRAITLPLSPTTGAEAFLDWCGLIYPAPACPLTMAEQAAQALSSSWPWGFRYQSAGLSCDQLSFRVH